MKIVKDEGKPKDIMASNDFSKPADKVFSFMDGKMTEKKSSQMVVHEFQQDQEMKVRPTLDNEEGVVLPKTVDMTSAIPGIED